MEHQKDRQLSSMESVRSYLYNVRYYWDWSQQQLINKQFDTVFILGKKYNSDNDNSQNYHQTNSKIIQANQNIIWITYRQIIFKYKFLQSFQFNGDNLIQLNLLSFENGYENCQYRYNFEALLPQDYDQQYIYDTGWGCMLRVGQMMMAEALKRNFFYEEWIQNNIQQQQYEQIIQYFLDQSKYKLSIQNIAKISQQKMDIQPGQWYNPSDISYSLKYLIEQEQSLNKFKITIFSDNMLFFDQINQKFNENNQDTIDQKLINQNQCECHIEQLDKVQDSIIEQQIGSKIIIQKNDKKYSNIQLCQYCQQCTNGVLVIILTRLGLDKINEIYLKSVEKMLEIQQFCGILGGRPKMAHYFVGIQNQNMIYLDPHYPQESKKETKYDTYFNKQMRLLQSSKMSPSMAITFYLNKPRDAILLKQSLQNIQKIERDNFFLSLYDQTPEYINQSENQDQGSFVIQNFDNDEWQII